jgi:hypothetical protein
MPHLPPGSPPVRRAPPPADRLTCDDALAQIEPHLDGDLAVAAAERLAAHLEDCPGCAAELRLAAEIRHELRSLPELDCPPHVLARISQASSSRGAGRRSRDWRHSRQVANGPGSKAREGRTTEAYSKYVERVRPSATQETGPFPAPQQRGHEKCGSTRVTAEARQTIGGRRRRLPWRPRSAKPWSRAAAAWRAALAAGVVAALLVGGAAWHALHRAPGAQAGNLSDLPPQPLADPLPGSPKPPGPRPAAPGGKGTPPPLPHERVSTGRAAREARFALAYIDRVSRRAALELRDQVLARHLVLPAARGLSRSLAATLDRAAHASPRSGAGPGPAGAVRERS